MVAAGHERAEWVNQAIIKERERIQHALSFLAPICDALKEVGDVIVIKSLDHWPDLGNDLDLYTNAEPADVVAVMSKHFKARPDARSWGDRLANKWNFVVPGLPELVEVHISRLGQTGEQVAITNSLVSRSSLAAVRWTKLSACPLRKIASSSALCSACTATFICVFATLPITPGWSSPAPLTMHISRNWRSLPAFGMDSRLIW